MQVKVLTVNEGETGAEWATPSSGVQASMAVAGLPFPESPVTTIKIINIRVNNLTITIPQDATSVFFSVTDSITNWSNELKEAVENSNFVIPALLDGSAITSQSVNALMPSQVEIDTTNDQITISGVLILPSAQPIQTTTLSLEISGYLIIG